MASRYFVEQLGAAEEVELEGNEAHHLLHVVRLRPGDRVLLFDGKGTDADAVIVATSRRKVELRVEELRRHPPETSGLTLAVAPPKGERLRWMVEKLTELGVSRWVPLLTERGVVTPGEGRQSKMPQWVIEAARQCGRHHLMEIDSPVSLADFLTEREQAGLLLAHPGGEPVARVLDDITGGPLQVLVGPEGGFTEEEVSLAREHGAVLVGLGSSILRIETAAMALAATCQLLRNG